jgi:hypothetical protein
MRKLVSVLILASTFAVLVTAARGGEPVESLFPTAKISYTAEDHTTFNGDSYQYKIYYAPGKMRSEFDIIMRSGAKVSSVSINRIDKKLSWTLQEGQKTYVTMRNKEKVPTAMLATDGLINVYLYKRVEQSRAGDEDVNGVKASKYKISLENPDGSKLAGFVWRTKDDVVVKLDVVEASSKGGSQRLFRELKNVKFGPVDAKLFEVPAGFAETMSGYVKQ